MKPVIVDELIKQNRGFDEGELIESLWALYEAVHDDHSGRHFEAECPQCVAIKTVERLSADPEI